LRNGGDATIRNKDIVLCIDVVSRINQASVFDMYSHAIFFFSSAIY
jgi:hypothetical protein